MTSKTSKSGEFASDNEKAKITGGQQGSVLKGERAPQDGKVQYTDAELRAIGEKAKSPARR